MEKQYITNQDYYRTLKMFTDIASTYKLLNKKEERALIAKYRDDREKLNQLLINHNIRIVLNQARKYVKRVANPADLLVDGYYGLSIAAQRFDVDKNIKFNTYATPWVFKYVISSFYSKSPEIGVNAFSINQNIGDSSENSFESIISAEDTQNAYSDRYSKPSIEKELSYFTIKDVVTTIIDKLGKSMPMSPLRQAIIQRNLFDGESLAKISADCNVDYAEATAEKRSITAYIKNMLTTDYNINELSDIV